MHESVHGSDHLYVTCVLGLIKLRNERGRWQSSTACIATTFWSHLVSLSFFSHRGYFAKLHVHYTRIWLIGLHGARCTGNVSFQHDRCESNRSQQRPTTYFTQAVKAAVRGMTPYCYSISLLVKRKWVPSVWSRNCRQLRRGETRDTSGRKGYREGNERWVARWSKHNRSVWLLRAFYRAKCTAGMSPQCNRRYFTGTSLFTCGQIALALEIE